MVSALDEGECSHQKPGDRAIDGERFRESLLQESNDLTKRLDMFSQNRDCITHKEERNLCFGVDVYIFNKLIANQSDPNKKKISMSLYFSLALTDKNFMLEL